ncbi:MAG TPA: Flp family type IVb pilin [Armatimonadota bacterium]
MIEMLKRLVKDEDGQNTLEYTIVAAVIIAAAIWAAGRIGNVINNKATVVS